MTLEAFVKEFVAKNTLIRLWYEAGSGYDAVVWREEGHDELSMEWVLLKGEGIYAKYLQNEVIGVTDILVPGAHVEAINIVIKK